MRSIGIFGGSFDPVHLGHLQLIEAAREASNLDEVLLMPCWRSPFKAGTVASGEQRFEMLQLAVEEREMGAWAHVSDYEILRPGPSYSWQTVEHLQVTYAADEPIRWCWILGTDQWQVIDQWAESEKLRRSIRFIVITRNKTDVQNRSGWDFLPVNFNHPASSTRIRSQFPQLSEWVPIAVNQYCRRNGLYVCI